MVCFLFCIYTCFVAFISKDVGPVSGAGDEGYFVPPVKGTSQSQVISEHICLAEFW